MWDQLLLEEAEEALRKRKELAYTNGLSRRFKCRGYYVDNHFINPSLDHFKPSRRDKKTIFCPNYHKKRK